MFTKFNIFNKLKLTENSIFKKSQINNFFKSKTEVSDVLISLSALTTGLFIIFTKNN